MKVMRCSTCPYDPPCCDTCTFPLEPKQIEYKKPPLGVPPRKIWNLTRLQDIIRAIEDYTEAGLEIDLEWIKEYNELITEVNKK